MLSYRAAIAMALAAMIGSPSIPLPERDPDAPPKPERDEDAAARCREDRKRRKAEAWAKRQPKAPPAV